MRRSEREITDKKVIEDFVSEEQILRIALVQLVDDTAEKRIGLHAIMKQTTKQTEWYYNDKVLDAMAVYKLEVQKISCKANIG